MSKRRMVQWRRVLQAVVIGGVVCTGPALHVAPATAQPSASDPRILARFDFAQGQTPEAITLAPDGSADVSLARASTAVSVAPDGSVTPLGAVPRSGGCPVLGIPWGAGIARAHDGSVYLVDCAGDADTGVWRLHGPDPATQVARLPRASVPHGMALDGQDGDLYVADSSLGVVWKIPSTGGEATVWASGPALQRVSLFGANGVAVHNDAVWVSNTDQGTIVEIPIRADGTAGPTRVVASGMAGDIGSFAVFGRDDRIVAALTRSNEVVLIRRGAPPQVLLTAADGLSNPTAVAVANGTLYVSNGAYFTDSDPNVLVAGFGR